MIEDIFELDQALKSYSRSN